MLVDLGDAPETACTHCLEELFKAMAVSPRGDDSGIWKPHENPLLRGLVEDWSSRMTALLRAMQDEFAAMMTGKPIGGDLRKAAYPGMVWSQEDFDRARAHLASIPQEQWTLDDYMLACDFIIQRYLPEGVIRDEADYLTVRSALLGKIQATMDAVAARHYVFEAGQAAEIANLLPTSFRRVPVGVLTPRETQTLAFARSRAGESISGLKEAQRARMKQLITEHLQAMALGQSDGGTVERLRTRISDTFALTNADFRRIAVTEAGDAQATGYIAAQPAGTMVRRIEAYADACDWCKSINGKVFRVVAPNDPTRNGETDVWVGKSNIGRSASPRKRQGDLLVDRPTEERWWVAAGAQHPHCRGTWGPAPGQPPKGVDPAFAAWLNTTLAATAPKPPGKSDG